MDVHQSVSLHLLLEQASSQKQAHQKLDDQYHLILHQLENVGRALQAQHRFQAQLQALMQQQLGVQVPLPAWNEVWLQPEVSPSPLAEPRNSRHQLSDEHPGR